MKLYCKTCSVELTKEIVELTDFTLISQEDGTEHIPVGYYMIHGKGYPENSGDKIYINLNDLINKKHHPIQSRLNGCCGLDGLDGINTVCMNDHDIGTESSDCWMPHYFAFEPNLVKWEGK